MVLRDCDANAVKPVVAGGNTLLAGRFSSDWRLHTISRRSSGLASALIHGPDGMEQFDVFISYKTDDQPWVEWLGRHLQDTEV